MIRQLCCPLSGQHPFSVQVSVCVRLCSFLHRFCLCCVLLVRLPPSAFALALPPFVLLSSCVSLCLCPSPSVSPCLSRCLCSSDWLSLTRTVTRVSAPVFLLWSLLVSVCCPDWFCVSVCRPTLLLADLTAFPFCLPACHCIGPWKRRSPPRHPLKRPRANLNQQPNVSAGKRKNQHRCHQMPTKFSNMSKKQPGKQTTGRNVDTPGGACDLCRVIVRVRSSHPRPLQQAGHGCTREGGPARTHPCDASSRMMMRQSANTLRVGCLCGFESYTLSCRLGELSRHQTVWVSPTPVFDLVGFAGKSSQGKPLTTCGSVAHSASCGPLLPQGMTLLLSSVKLSLCRAGTLSRNRSRCRL